MSIFKKLFESYGYSVEAYGNSGNSYIADNGIFCIPFTEYNNTIDGTTEMSGVSFLSDDKDAIKKHYKNREDDDVFADWMIGAIEFVHIGGICNHDYSISEVDSWLRSAYFRKRRV